MQKGCTNRATLCLFLSSTQQAFSGAARSRLRSSSGRREPMPKRCPASTVTLPATSPRATSSSATCHLTSQRSGLNCCSYRIPPGVWAHLKHRKPSLWERTKSAMRFDCIDGYRGLQPLPQLRIRQVSRESPPPSAPASFASANLPRTPGRRPRRSKNGFAAPAPKAAGARTPAACRSRAAARCIPCSA